MVSVLSLLLPSSSWLGHGWRVAMRNGYKVLEVINNFVFAAALITAFFIVLWLVEAI